MIEPHLIRGSPHIAQGAVTDAGTVSANKHVAIKGEVGTAGIAMTMNLGDRGFVHLCERAQAALELLDVPGIVIDTNTPSAFYLIILVVSGGSEIVAGAK